MRKPGCSRHVWCLARRMEVFDLKVIAEIKTPYSTKFGIPRQSGIVNSPATIVFKPGYRHQEAFRGIEGFSHLWLIWVFDRNLASPWKPTVRPPKLGGNIRMGVFATRSPFRPNPIGISVVQFERIEFSHLLGPILHIRGADLADGTPILDIKPYLPQCDSIPHAVAGFTANINYNLLQVEIPPNLQSLIPAEYVSDLQKILAQDPRPSYQDDPTRTYGFTFADLHIRFRVQGDTLIVTDIQQKN